MEKRQADLDQGGNYCCIAGVEPRERGGLKSSSSQKDPVILRSGGNVSLERGREFW